jgi:tRNA(fMet)-specific endonuclease VapC
METVVFGDDAAREYGRIMAEQRAKGKPVGEADVHIAAVARCEGLTLLTADKHFALIEGLQVENWLDLEDAEA